MNTATAIIRVLAVDLPKTHPCADPHRHHILQAIDDLLVVNCDEIQLALVKSSKNARTISINIKIDTSCGLPDIGVKFSIAQEARKDSRRISGEDPDQDALPLTELTEETEVEPKTKSKKK